jgi:hypothetical protein
LVQAKISFYILGIKKSPAASAGDFCFKWKVDEIISDSGFRISECGLRILHGAGDEFPLRKGG